MNTRTVDLKTFAIGTLTVTACILFVGFLLVTLNPRPAFASGMVDRAGDYVMVTQQVSNSTEVVCVIDAAVPKMIVYSLNPGTRQIVIMQQWDLSVLPLTPDQMRRQRGAR